MKTDREIVRAYYNQTAEGEWKRIENRPEFLLTCRFLDRIIHPGEKVLDIGGGPGRYSIHFAQRGCSVTLVDLAEENVRLAKEHAAEAGVKLEAYTGDALDVAELLAGREFDAVLLMGPLYHLLETDERVRAVDAALKLTKPGGLFCASFILMTSDLVYRMQHPENGSVLPELTDEVAALTEFQDNLLRGESYSGDAFTRAHFADISEIEPFLSQFPLDGITLLGQEGIMSPCERMIMAQKPEEIERWLELSEKLATRREYLGWAEHILAISRKKG